MKILQIVFINLLLSSYLFSSDSYCIQLKSMVNVNTDNLSDSTKSVVENFDKARIEKRGKYYVFRVGEYSSSIEASKDFKNLNKTFKDAYVRRCDYDELTFIYPVPVEKKTPSKEVLKTPKKSNDCFVPMYLELEKENNKTLKEHKGDYSESLYPKIEINATK